MTTDTIAEISIDASGRLHVRPTRSAFPYVWRAGMEVSWSERSSTLRSPLPRAWSYVDWYRQIVAAAKVEYGYTLVLAPDTRWINVPAELQEAIVEAVQDEA